MSVSMLYRLRQKHDISKEEKSKVHQTYLVSSRATVFDSLPTSPTGNRDVFSPEGMKGGELVP